jgi:hypothetical protein
MSLIPNGSTGRKEQSNPTSHAMGHGRRRRGKLHLNFVQNGVFSLFPSPSTPPDSLARTSCPRYTPSQRCQSRQSCQCPTFLPASIPTTLRGPPAPCVTRLSLPLVPDPPPPPPTHTGCRKGPMRWRLSTLCRLVGTQT